MDNGLITVPSDAPNGFPYDVSVNITSGKFEEGFPEADFTNLCEPISAMGVNYTRLRILRKDFKPFKFDVFSARTNWADAVPTARGIRQCKGRLVNSFVVIMGGITYTYTGLIYVIDVRAAPAAGITVGSTDYPTSTAFVSSSWILQFAGF